MKNRYLLDELLAENSPLWVPKVKLIETLGICDHELWRLGRELTQKFDREVEQDHQKTSFRYPVRPSIPLWLESLGGVVRLSLATKRIVIEDSIQSRKFLVVLSSRKTLKFVPFAISEDGTVEAAELREYGVARGCRVRLEQINSVLQIGRFEGDPVALRRFVSRQPAFPSVLPGPSEDHDCPWASPSNGAPEEDFPAKEAEGTLPEYPTEFDLPETWNRNQTATAAPE